MHLRTFYESIIAELRKPQAHDGAMRAFAVLVLLVWSFASVVIAEPIDYAKKIKPIFAARCKACHGVLKQEAGLRLDTGALARQGGYSGTIIAPGKSASSE